MGGRAEGLTGVIGLADKTADSMMFILFMCGAMHADDDVVCKRATVQTLFIVTTASHVQVIDRLLDIIFMPIIHQSSSS